MISISHSPNSNGKQQLKCLAWLLLPWKWPAIREGKIPKIFEQSFGEYLGEKGFVTTFSAAREGLYAILQALNIKEGDEVIMQSYTCIVVPNAVTWSGAQPVYVDIDESYNLDPQKLAAAITNNTKAIIVQHTFGYPAQMKQILAIADERNIPVIEDCAHSLGAEIDGKKVGTFGIASLFSFGRDKMISSVSGGAIYTQNDELAAKLSSLQAISPKRPLGWVLQNLLHPILVPVTAALMGKLRLGQLLMKTFQSVGLLNKVYLKAECNGERPSSIMHKMPNALCSLALQQLHDFPEQLEKRQKHAMLYEEFCRERAIPFQQLLEGTPSYLRFTITDNHPDRLRTFTKKRGVVLGDWYKDVIMPKPKEWKTLNYKKGQTPRAELLSKKNINLPTHPKLSAKKRDYILSLLDSYYEQS